MLNISIMMFGYLKVTTIFFRNDLGNKMQINLLNIFTASENHYKVECTLSWEFISIDGQKKELQFPIHFEGVITRLGVDDYKIKGTVKVAFNTSCDRCTKDIVETVDVNIDKELSLAPNDEEFLQGSVLDLEKLLLEEIYLNLPVKTLCKEDCKGICSQCGADLNVKTCECEDLSIDPRLAKLKDLFKEV